MRSVWGGGAQWESTCLACMSQARVFNPQPQKQISNKSQWCSPVAGAQIINNSELQMPVTNNCHRSLQQIGYSSQEARNSCVCSGGRRTNRRLFKGEFSFPSKASRASPVPRGTLPLGLISPWSESTVVWSIEIEEGWSQWWLFHLHCFWVRFHLGTVSRTPVGLSQCRLQ